MSAKRREQRKLSNVIELKAGTFTLPVLRLIHYRLDEIRDALAGKVRQAPEMFRNAPIAIDVDALEDEVQGSDFEDLIGAIGALGVHVVGIRGASAAQEEAARAAGLAVLSESRSTAKEANTPKAQAQRHETAVAGEHFSQTAPSTARVTSLLVDKPVRSGQRIYANGDLIVLATVSAGAEIIADGNIHVYGSLRGRALAGVQGDLSARIFCTDLQAELVSISGQYQISDAMAPALRGKPAQIYLSGDSLCIESL